MRALRFFAIEVGSVGSCEFPLAQAVEMESGLYRLQGGRINCHHRWIIVREYFACWIESATKRGHGIKTNSPVPISCQRFTNEPVLLNGCGPWYNRNVFLFVGKDLDACTGFDRGLFTVLQKAQRSKQNYKRDGRAGRIIAFLSL